jgi:hypothetical protein
MCIIDTVIMVLAITVVFMAENRYSGRFLEILRFVQILRFLHIDRQMISWILLKNFIDRSSFELISIYYIVCFIFCFLACSVFTLESHRSKGGLIDDASKGKFVCYKKIIIKL